MFFNDLSHIKRVPNLERACCKQHFISENTDTPDINFFVIVFIFDYLRRSVDRSPTLSVSQCRSINSPSKVTNFNSVFMNKNVLSLDISVNDISAMHMIDCRTYLFYIFFDLLFFQDFFAQLLIHIRS